MPVSGLWIISNSFIFLLGVQILAGVTWAAYELAMLLLFFETIRPHERTGMLTVYNFANSVATAAGSILGGTLLVCCGKSEPVYLLLFGLSSAGLALALLALARVSKLNPAGHASEKRPTPAELRIDPPSFGHRDQHALTVVARIASRGG